jgi:hypothetical protein
MQTYFINISLALVTLATATGIFLHDTQVDRATAVALAAPAVSILGYAAIDKDMKSSDPHTHVDRASAPRHINGIRAMMPRIQPRDDDHRRSQDKRLSLSGSGDNVSIWPSV